METCEKCGKKFSLADGAEVTSARILCPECEAERRAAKLAKANASNPASAGKPASAAPAAPRPAPRPTPTAAAAPKPAPAPAVKPVVKPEAPAVKPAAPAARPAAPAATKAAAPRPAPGRPAARPAEPETDHAAARQALKHLDLNQDAKIVKYGWMAAAAFLIITLAVVFYTKSVRNAREAAEAAVLKQKNDFLETARRHDLNTEDGCKRAITQIEDANSKLIWGGTDIATDILNILAKAKTNQENIKNRADITDQVTKVNAKMANPSALSTEDLSEVQRTINELESKITILDQKTQDEFKGHRKVAAKTLALKLHEDAKAFAGANRDKPEQALVRYARAEDEVVKLFEAAIREATELEQKAKKDASLAPAAAEAGQTRAAFEQRYKDIIAESDALSEAAFPPEVVEKKPWRDLLAPDAKWSAAALQGFEHRVDSGVLYVKGPDAATRKEGVMSIGDKEQWRDFMVDFEFTFESGSMRMFFRMGRTIVNTESMQLTSYASGSAPPLQGKTYQGEAWVIGSKFHFHLKTEGVDPIDSDIKWVNSRKGALGIIVPDGTKIRFSRLRVRELR